MNSLLVKYMTGCYVYGVVRNLVYVPKLKDNEYMLDRVVGFGMWTAASPILAPTFIYCDLRNIEHKLRKMSGPINRCPW
mgnify:CR=1 FL=1